MTINSTYVALYKLSTARNVFLGLALIALVNLVLFPGFPTLFTQHPYSIGSILDLQFSYSPQEVTRLFMDMGAGGRWVYLLSTILIDVPYALCYGPVYSMLLLKLYKGVSGYKMQYLILLPLLISLFDILENIGIVTLINLYPGASKVLTCISSAATSLKWISAICVATIMVFGIVRFVGRITFGYWSKRGLSTPRDAE